MAQVQLQRAILTEGSAALVLFKVRIILLLNVYVIPSVQVIVISISRRQLPSDLWNLNLVLVNASHLPLVSVLSIKDR